MLSVAADWPSLQIDIGLGSGPGTAIASVTWTDITQYVRSISIQRGKNHELEASQTATAIVEVNNHDRRFEPENPGSPYYPNVLPMTPLRIQALWNGVTYPVGVFYVGEFPVTWRGQTDSNVSLVCANWLEVLNNFLISATYGAELSGARVANVLNAAGHAVGDRAISTGQSTIPAATLTNQSALSYLQQVTFSELGALFVDRSGVLTFLDRNTLAALTSSATYGDAGAELPYKDMTFTFTKNELRNNIVLTPPSGNPQTVSDATSIARYGTRSYPMSVLLSDVDALSLAGFISIFYKDPHSRITSLIVNPRTNASLLWPKVLGHELMDKVTVKRTPPPSGSRITKDVAIEGMRHDITQNSGKFIWNTTINTGVILSLGGWILSTSALGTDTLLAF